MPRRILRLLLLPTLLQAAPPDLVNPPDDAARMASGIAYKVTHPGQGEVALGPKGLLRVHFTGWSATGATFANTRAQDEAPYLSPDRLMPGMRESLLAMKVGESRRVWIPEALAFAGAKGKPAGTVVMDLELLECVPNPDQAPIDVAGPPSEAVLLRSGLASRVLRAGTGQAHPDRNAWISVHYSGWTTDGKLFDSSLPRGTSTGLDLRNTIPGWIEGIQLMVVGERRRFWIPEKLAYRGEAGKPAGTLVFDVELVAFHN